MKKSVEVTVYSPISVMVYSGSEEALLMMIDLNSGRDYNSNYVVAEEKIKLVFKTANMRKEVEIGIPDDYKVKFFLGSILTEAEILSNFNREEAIALISSGTPTSYTYEQIANVGQRSDIPILMSSLVKLSKYQNNKNNYLLARGVYALGKIGGKYSTPNLRAFVEGLYKTYPEKEMYGHYFKSAIDNLN